MFYGCPNNNKVHFILPSPWILETNDSIKGCVAGNSAAGQIPPWADTPLDKMVEVLTQKATLIPASIVGNLFLESFPGGRTPRALWATYVEPLLGFPERLADFAPFVDWDRVAYSGVLG